MNRRSPRSYYEYPQRAGDDVYTEDRQSMSVDEIDTRAEWSGLFDADGRRLYKPKPKMGFDI